MNTKMKSTLAALLLCPLLTMAQAPVLGFRAGLNLTTLSQAGNLYDNSSIRTGASVAVTAQYNLTSQLALAAEIAYDEKGIIRTEGSGALESKTSRRFDYLTIPLVLKGYYPGLEKVRLFGEAGTYGSLLLGSNASIKVNGEASQHQSSDPNISNRDFGWITGGGLEFPAGNHTVSLEMRFSRGIMNVDANDPDLRNKAFTLTAGYRF